MKTLLAYLKDESGVTAAEYGLILATVGGVIAAAVVLLGTNINTVINAVANTIVKPA